MKSTKTLSKAKLNLILLLIMIVGLLIVGYYYFRLSIKPCTAQPLGTLNCGGAGISDIAFLFVRTPIALFGAVALTLSLLRGHFNKNFNPRRYLKFTLIAFAILIAWLGAMFAQL